MASEKSQISHKSRWLKRSIPWAVLVVVVGGGALYWASQNHAGASTQTVQWMTVQTGNVQQTVSLSGTLNPANEVSLTGNGKINSISVKDGEKVQAEQVIAQLDTSSYTPQLQGAQASLKSAEAKLAQAEEPTTVQNGKLGATTQSPDPNSVAQAEASVEQAQAQVNSIEQQITACTIKSPIAGTVLQVENPSQAVSSGGSNSGASNSNNAGNAIAVIADLSPSDFEVQASVDQADAANIHSGQTATISLGTSNGQSLTGKVESIGYMPETQSGVTTYPVTIQLDTPKSLNTTLLPGQSVTATIVEKQSNNVLMLPTAAITQKRGTTGVYIKSSSNAANSSSANSLSGGQTIPSNLQFQPVTVGLYGGNDVEIKSGLTDGQQVAVLLPSQSEASSGNSSNGFGGMGMMSGFGGMRGGSGGRSSSGGGSFGGGRSSSGGGNGHSFSGGGNG